MSGGASSRDKYGRSGVQWQVGFFVSAQQLAISLRLHKLSITDGHLRKVMHQGHMLRQRLLEMLAPVWSKEPWGTKRSRTRDGPAFPKLDGPINRIESIGSLRFSHIEFFRQSAKKVTASKTDVVGANSFLHVEGPC